MSLDQISFLPPEQQQEILNGPALLPPNGTRPNFDNSPNNNGLGIAALTGTYVGYIYLNYRLLVVCGFFVHQWDVRVKEMSQILYLITVGSTLYSITVGLLKVVILREFCGIFVPLGGRNAFWWACHVLMGLNIAYYFATGIFVTNFSCTPREKIWDKTIPGGHCIDNKVTYLAASVVNVISDFIILALPQKIIWNLKMPTRSKIGASAVFAVGLFPKSVSPERAHKPHGSDGQIMAQLTIEPIKVYRIDESRGGLNTTASVGPPQEAVERPKVAILYTKHFTATEGQARDSIETDQLNRQHPWTNYKHN
ncbi:hypothetical protein DL765_009398 [Monosporascus sp. GIB2]|nr:hypothetical protein DL765_009398 [Monosporascus sp. GIB2]